MNQFFLTDLLMPRNHHSREVAMLNEYILKIIDERDEARSVIMEMFRLRLGVYNFEKQNYVYHVFDTYFNVRDYLIMHGLLKPEDCVEVNADDE